jgi:hypothetical protein
MMMMISDLISATVVDCFVMWVVIVSVIYHCGRVGGILLVHFASKVSIKFGSASYHYIIVSLTLTLIVLCRREFHKVVITGFCHDGWLPPDWFDDIMN